MASNSGEKRHHVSSGDTPTKDKQLRSAHKEERARSSGTRLSFSARKVKLVLITATDCEIYVYLSGPHQSPATLERDFCY